jgi:hypothetical protein
MLLTYKRILLVPIVSKQITDSDSKRIEFYYLAYEMECLCLRGALGGALLGTLASTLLTTLDDEVATIVVVVVVVLLLLLIDTLGLSSPELLLEDTFDDSDLL